MHLHKDIEALVDSCALMFSKDSKHYIDYAPGISPDADDRGSECRVDGDGAALYLGALHDASIWPATRWKQSNAPNVKGETIGSLIESLRNFQVPIYDDCDSCEFCEGVKVNFSEQLELIKNTQKDRLWGLCLDCWKAGGINTRSDAGKCRYEHA